MSISAEHPAPGLKPVYFATGVIENRDDPLQMGMAQVRVYGLHPAQIAQDETRGMSTSDLPWYPVRMPTNSAGVSGIGISQAAPVPGTVVTMEFTDPYGANGYITGTLYTNPTQFAAIGTSGGYGFRDPSGMYPTQTGPSLSHDISLGRGAGTTENNIRRNNNTGVAIQPDGSVPGEQPLDNDPNFSLYQMIRDDEGYRAVAYPDLSGNGWTIGVGHLIQPGAQVVTEQLYQNLSNQIGRKLEYHPGVPPSITQEEGAALFERDIQRFVAASSSNRFPKTKAAHTAAGDNLPRHWALWNMAFQMGEGGLEGFNRFLGACAAGEWKQAASFGLQSNWANQTPGRAKKVMACISTGNCISYGVMPE